MKNGTLYSKRVRKVFAKLKKELGEPESPVPTDPVEQLIIGLLSVDAPVSRAVRAAKMLEEAMVDINEVRVSTAAEISVIIGPYVSNSMLRADSIRRALNAIYRKEHAITLDHLHKVGRREAKQYLDDLDGVDASAAASVVLWSLGGHAIPVDQRMHGTLRKEELVEPSATADEVQAFLERNINASDAKAFCLLMQNFVGSKSRRSSDASSTKSATSRASKRKPARSATTGAKGASKAPKTATKRDK